ncbi:hypothetical protein N431DRAFT_465651 [Stipitochalara longipes BDJ]|nr:hypothetical protein N431DRAFT_465651 [Stipitochalara longipes BDJ]
MPEMSQIDKMRKYSTLADDEQENIPFIRSSEKLTDSAHLESQREDSKWKKLLPWVVHLTFCLVYISISLTWKRPGKFLERFRSLSDAPIEYQTIQFSNNTGSDTTPFQGPSNPETDAAWSKLLDVGPGLIWIDDETAKRLPKSTARRFNGDGDYVGVVEMFHQLHCLNRIRLLFYNSSWNVEHESPAIFKAHTDHCFDYLRETLMCHGDLDIMSMNWEPAQHIYTAQFDVIKQCRNFDLIKKWTSDHQTGWWPPHSH